MKKEEYRIEGEHSEVTPESPRRLIIDSFIMCVATGLVVVLLGLSIYQWKEINKLERKISDCIKNK